MDERREALTRIREGLDSIATGMEHAKASPGALVRALEMHLLGHQDIIDNILYATAMEYGLLFLTIDDKLIDFLERHGLPRSHVVEPEELSFLAPGPRFPEVLFAQCLGVEGFF